MFIERSAARVRRARSMFVLLGVLPFAVLAGWAVHRASQGHRDDIRDRWQHAVGLGLAIDAVEHPRPGVTRARGVSVVSPSGSRIVTFPVVEVEAGVGEDRLRFEAARIDASAAQVLGELAREWLRRDARHPRNCVIDVAGVAWLRAGAVSDAAAASRDASLRVECVARDGTRAIRVLRPEHVGDLLRVVRSVIPGDASLDGERVEIEVALDDAMPLDVAAAFAGYDESVSDVAGDGASISGRCSAVADDRGWQGDASGRLLGLDLARCVAPLGARAAGEARVEVDRLSWRAGRIVDAAARCRVGPGWVDTAFFDRLSLALGCRPARTTPDAGGGRTFDTAGFDARTDGGRVLVAAPGDAPGGLAIAAGAVVLHEPSAAVPFERLAWVLSPPSATFVPAGGAGAWLMTIQPREGGREAALPQGEPAGRPRQEF